MEVKINCEEALTLILSKNNNSYQPVIDDFKNARNIKICTYNISAKNNKLIDLLTALPKSTSVILITNIPNRFDVYYKERYRERAGVTIKNYLEKLSPKRFQASVQVYFNFSNHAKIIMTDNLAYIGSGNFSDESENSIESGILVKSESIIRKIDQEFVSRIIAGSTRYYDRDHDDLLIELRYYQHVISEIKSAVLDKNEIVLHHLQHMEIAEFQLDIDNADIIELLIMAEAAGEALSIFFDHPDLHELIVDILDDIKIISQCCGYGKELDVLTSFRLDRELQNKFEEMGHLDDGENTDEILLRAQQDAIDKLSDLKALSKAPISDLAGVLPGFLENLGQALELIERINTAQKSIDNSNG